MSLERWSVPLAAGLAAAAAAFAVVALGSNGDGNTLAPASTEPAPAAVAVDPGDAEAGAQVFARMGCGNCHRLDAANSRGQIGPDLDGLLQAHTRRSLTQAVLRPPAGTAMPADFGERMNAAELHALVTFLLSARK